MYTFDSRIRYSETDENAVLTPESLINYFQDCSTFQTEDAGAGLDWLSAQHLAWVLNYWQIDVFRLPRLYERVRVGTVPYALKGFMGLRNYVMDAIPGTGEDAQTAAHAGQDSETEAGALPGHSAAAGETEADFRPERLAVANSVWTLMNMEKMYPERISPEHAARYTLEEKLPMTYTDRKIRIPEGGEERRTEPVIIHHGHLDTNRHVNNGQYVRIALNALAGLRDGREGAAGQGFTEQGSGAVPAAGNFPLRIRAEYKKQAHLGDELVPVIHHFGKTEASGYDVHVVDLRMGEESCCVVELSRE